MLFTDVITVYNRYIPESNDPFPSKPVFIRTVIKNVQWQDRTQVNSDGGKSFIGKTVSVIIPLEADADKEFIVPEKYEVGYWTLNKSSPNPDIIVFGECDKEISDSYTVDQLRNDYKTCNIQAVNDFTHVSMKPHWEVSGV